MDRDRWMVEMAETVELVTTKNVRVSFLMGMKSSRTSFDALEVRRSNRCNHQSPINHSDQGTTNETTSNKQQGRNWIRLFFEQNTF